MNARDKQLLREIRRSPLGREIAASPMGRAEQLRREIDALDLHPFAAEHIHSRFFDMRDQAGDPFAVWTIRREIRRIAGRELRYYAENADTFCPTRKGYRLRRQADRFERRP